MNAFDKIIGYSSIKRELKQISDALKNTGAYARLGVSALDCRFGVAENSEKGCNSFCKTVLHTGRRQEMRERRQDTEGQNGNRPKI